MSAIAAVTPVDRAEPRPSSFKVTMQGRTYATDSAGGRETNRKVCSLRESDESRWVKRRRNAPETVQVCMVTNTDWKIG
jgi:hypothetical protein